MKIGTGTKVTIGIIGIIAAATIGFLISTHQLNSTKTDEGRIAATAEQGGANAPEKTSDAPGKLSDVSTRKPSDKQGVMDRDKEEGWNALMEILDEMAETPDTRTTTGQSGTSQSGTLQTASSGTDSETNPDQPEMEYHESYNTFIGITRNITQAKAEMDRAMEEMKWMYTEWQRSVRDPKNPTEEERAELKEIGSMKVDYGELQSDFNSLASELIIEIGAVAPGAIQTESQDFGPKGTRNTVRIDYNQIQSELGSPPEEDDANLAQFFADFQLESWEGGMKR